MAARTGALIDRLAMRIRVRGQPIGRQLRALDRGADPYLAEPLGSCERVSQPAPLASGRAKDAASAYKRVVADRERALGPDHLDTIRAQYRLGAAFQRTGKTVAAERAYEQARVGFARLLGPRHPDTLRSSAELARVYVQLGRYGDARALLRDTVDRLERILPPNDPLIPELREILADIGSE